jgi:hypothetical protein
MIPLTIPENHRATIRSVASKKRIGETELTRLYEACSELLTTGRTKALGLMPSRLEHPITVPDGVARTKLVVVTVTNEQGVYVQQAQEVGQVMDHSRSVSRAVLLTIGQKYSMEGTDPVTSTIATRHF